METTENKDTKANPNRKLKFFNLFLSAAIMTVAVLSVIAMSSSRFLEQLELKTYDFRTSMPWDNAQHRPSDEVIILKFDDTTLNVLSDKYGLWPWPRDVHASIIEYLNKAGVRTMLFDIMFVSFRKGSEEGDRVLAESFHKHQNVYFAMNLDRTLEQSERLGKGLTPNDVRLLTKLSIPVDVELDKTVAPDLQLAPNGFFNNPNMTFNYYRAIMPSLMSKESHIGIINHGLDIDGVSRSNPLFFRFEYHAFVKTDAFPLHKVGDHWFDSKNRMTDSLGYLIAKTTNFPLQRTPQGTLVDNNGSASQPVDSEGYLLNYYGQYRYQRAYLPNGNPQIEAIYLPYLGLQALLDTKFPDDQRPRFKITKNGHLQFPGYDIPLNEDGDFQVNWYNINVTRERVMEQLPSLKQLRQTFNSGSPEEKRNIQRLDATISQYEAYLNTPWTPQPYQEIAAWEIITLMDKEKQGIPLTQSEANLKNALKGKIVFVGATAVAAYDLKNTPINSTLPGVILQANLFDNLYQNNHFIQRLSSQANVSITLLLCIAAISLMFRLRSALWGMVFSATLALIYTFGVTYLFKFHFLWINLAVPLTALVITTLLTYVLKYFLKDQDYQKTYTLATTDSMTGLYNHRFFQEHMQRSIEQADRLKYKFSLVLIDIDFFKKFNDTYGHQAGDEVLRAVARKLKKQVRTVDAVARYGGEEMAVVLDRASEEEGLIVADKLVRAIAEEAYPIAEGVAKHVTISCGVATYPTHGSTPSELIEFADQGLYRAKENGRNQVGAQYASEGDHQQSAENSSGAA